MKQQNGVWIRFYGLLFAILLAVLAIGGWKGTIETKVQANTDDVKQVETVSRENEKAIIKLAQMAEDVAAIKEYLLQK